MELLITMRAGQHSRWAYYQTFVVGDEASKYTLTVADYDPGSSAGDSFSYHNGVPWSTYDQDNDLSHFDHCASLYGGPWWYHTCAQVTLLNHPPSFRWASFSSALETASMRIRPARCQTGFGLACLECKPGYFLCTSALSKRTSCCDTGLSSCAQATATGL